MNLIYSRSAKNQARFEEKTEKKVLRHRYPPKNENDLISAILNGIGTLNAPVGNAEYDVLTPSLKGRTHDCGVEKRLVVRAEPGLTFSKGVVV